MSQSRQLAAIMFTDIVGYTALMGKDSKKALELVRNSKEFQKPLVEKYHGQWLKEMGDGALAKFGTAMDAVNCAVEIQRSSRADFDCDLRIGIHLGDITIENEDIFGDGVNIASRLESIADPGGIYISDAIEKAIRGQSDIQAKYLGESRLKNVDYGVRTYAIQGVGLPIPEVKKDKELSGHIWAEVQRRGIMQVAATYVLLSILLILLLPYLSSSVNLPEWSSTGLMSILIAGFPVALYLAWNYERSPKGFVKTTSRQSWQNPLSPSQRKPLTGTFLISGLTIVIFLMLFYPRFQSSGQESETSESLSDSGAIDKSIAVLPFVNISNDPEQEYFSDGMMEEILNHLVKVGELKVTSRTSTMQYKGKQKSIKEIAKELGVANILEGSVRKSGDKIRITVQLIDTKTDQHLWSETYDREFIDVFDIQSDVAQQVASALNARIQPQVMKSIDQVPTRNMESYDLYLKALGDVMFVTTDNDQEVRRELLRQAIKLDSSFSSAYALLGNNILFQAGFAGSGKASDVAKEAKKHLEKALLLDPLNGIAHSTMGGYYLWYEWDFNRAEIEYLSAIKLAPSDERSFAFYIDLLCATGRFLEAIPVVDKLLELSNTPGSWARLSLISAFNNDLDRLNTAVHYAKSEESINVFTYTEVARAYLIQKKYELIPEILEHSPDTKTIPRGMGMLAIAHGKLGNKSESDQWLESLIQRSHETSGGSPSFYIAMLYASTGDVETAFQWLGRSFMDKEIELYWLKVEPEFASLHEDPRWQDMLDKVGFPQ